MSRITERNLYKVIDRIVSITGNDNYSLGMAYGGNRLERRVNEHSGVVDELNTGYVSRPQLYAAMQAYIAGIRAGKDLVK